MNDLAGSACALHLAKGFFRGKVMAKKSPKQQEVAKMLGFLLPLQAVEIARDATATCCVKTVGKKVILVLPYFCLNHTEQRSAALCRSEGLFSTPILDPLPPR